MRAKPPRKPDEKSIAEQCEAQGIPAELFHDAIEAEREAEKPFEVDHENHDVVLLFLRCATQWRKIVPPMGGKVIYQGLDYPGIDIVIRRSGYRGARADAVFADLQTMERAALDELSQA